MTQAEIEQHYRWFGLAVTRLLPVLTEEEIDYLSAAADSIVKRFEINQKPDEEWPFDWEKAWNSLT